MPTLPWRWFSRPEPELQYVALLSYLSLKRAWRTPWFLLHTVRIMRQLRRSKGLVGYTFRAGVGAKRYWTLSAWEDEAVLRAFVHDQPHARTMVALAPHIEPTRFSCWMVKGSELPLSWEEALRRWSAP